MYHIVIAFNPEDPMLLTLFYCLIKACIMQLVSW